MSSSLQEGDTYVVDAKGARASLRRCVKISNRKRGGRSSSRQRNRKMLVYAYPLDEWGIAWRDSILVRSRPRMTKIDSSRGTLMQWSEEIQPRFAIPPAHSKSIARFRGNYEGSIFIGVLGIIISNSEKPAIYKNISNREKKVTRRSWSMSWGKRNDE